MGDAQQPAAADLLLQHSTSGREGGKTGLLEPAALQGGGWELEEAGMGMRGLGSRSCSPQDCQKHCPGPLPDPDNPPPSPGSASPPLSRGEPGVRGGHGGSQLSACGETLPNPQRGGGGGEPAAEGTPRKQTPSPPSARQRALPGKGVCSWAGGGTQGALGDFPAQPPCQEQGANSHAKCGQSWSWDKGWERQPLAGKGSPWLGALAGGSGAFPGSP